MSDPIKNQYLTARMTRICRSSRSKVRDGGILLSPVFGRRAASTKFEYEITNELTYHASSIWSNSPRTKPQQDVASKQHGLPYMFCCRRALSQVSQRRQCSRWSLFITRKVRNGSNHRRVQTYLGEEFRLAFRLLIHVLAETSSRMNTASTIRTLPRLLTSVHFSGCHKALAAAKSPGPVLPCKCSADCAPNSRSLCAM